MQREEAQSSVKRSREKGTEEKMGPSAKQIEARTREEKGEQREAKRRAT